MLEPFGYPLSSFVGEDWSAAQEAGGAAAWLGISGLIVPSARHADGNLVVFVNQMGPNDTLELLCPPSTSDV
jgi:RES domain-containing protein